MRGNRGRRTAGAAAMSLFLLGLFAFLVWPRPPPNATVRRFAGQAFACAHTMNCTTPAVPDALVFLDGEASTGPGGSEVLQSQTGSGHPSVFELQDRARLHFMPGTDANSVSQLVLELGRLFVEDSGEDPIPVLAGGVVIKPLGTRFLVWWTTGGIYVAVPPKGGRVQVSRRGISLLTLDAGHEITVPFSGAVPRPAPIDPAEERAWETVTCGWRGTSTLTVAPEMRAAWNGCATPGVASPTLPRPVVPTRAPPTHRSTPTRAPPPTQTPPPVVLPGKAPSAVVSPVAGPVSTLPPPATPTPARGVSGIATSPPSPLPAPTAVPFAPPKPTAAPSKPAFAPPKPTAGATATAPALASAAPALSASPSPGGGFDQLLTATATAPGTSVGDTPSPLPADTPMPTPPPTDTPVLLTETPVPSTDTPVPLPTGSPVPQPTCVAAYNGPPGSCDSATTFSSLTVQVAGNIIAISQIDLDFQAQGKTCLTATIVASDGQTIHLFDSCISDFQWTGPLVFRDGGKDMPCPPPGSGVYQPVTHLSNLKGAPAKGQWTLRIEDTCSKSCPVLKSWTLHLITDAACAG